VPVLKPTRGLRLNKSHPLARGLVGCWLMNEGSGNKVFDLSGNRKTGSLVADTHFVPGKFGPALSFDGDDSVDCGNMGITSYPLTILAWGKADAITAGHCLAGFVDASAENQQLRIDFIHGIPDRARIFWYSGSPVDIYSQSTLSTGIWYQLVGVFVSDTEKHLYLNGVLEKTETTSYTIPTGLNKLGIGRALDNTPSGGFNGIIDHVMIYNRILSSSEIALLYREPFCMFKDPAEIALLGGYQSVGGEEFIRTFEDGIGILDTMGRTQVQLRTIADGIGTLDDAGRTQVQLRAVADSLGIIDALWKGETRIFADVLEITDAVTRSQVLARTITDDVGLVDGVDRLMTYARILAETLGLSDALWKADAKIVSDDIGISDSVARIQAQARIIADAMGITDDVTRLQVQLRTIADTLDLTDLMTPGQVITFAEAMGISDSITRTQVQIRTVADSLGITDDLTRIAAYVFTQTDDIGIADAMIRVAVKLRTISDDIGMTDARDVSHIVAGLFKAAWAFMILRQEQ